jgi:WhiB family redox-sensing transcriptional regulator
VADRLDQLQPPEWAKKALCLQYPEVSFFPGTGESTSAAKAVCCRCLVIDSCLAYAIADDSLVGVWGETTEQDRHRYRRRLELGIPREPALPSTTERARRVAHHRATALDSGLSRRRPDAP